jgi:histidyl-tRNA synthetase
VAAGGRYDGLVKSLGGPDLPGIGFAMGLERLVLMKGAASNPPEGPELFLCGLGDAAADTAFMIMSALQKNLIHAEMDYQGKSLKAQMRRANKLGARMVLILGEEELSRGYALLKNMADGSQQEIKLEMAIPQLLTLLGPGEN